MVRAAATVARSDLEISLFDVRCGLASVFGVGTCHVGLPILYFSVLLAGLLRMSILRVHGRGNACALFPLNPGGAVSVSGFCASWLARAIASFVSLAIFGAASWQH